MPRSFDMSADYDGTVEQVHRAFADEQYWLARLADSGADDATLDSMDLRPDGGIAVATTQVLRRDRLPGIVTQFHKGDLRIGRREIWSPVDGDKSTAHVTGDISGAPVTLGGDAALTAKGDGARLAFHGTVEVRVPLVGGKIESFVSSQLVDLLIAEQRFTTRWLTENP
jgi:Protein of unknown function (DUF2505)